MVDGREENKENGVSENGREGLNDQMDGSADVNDTLRGSSDPEVEVIEEENGGADMITLDDVRELVDVTAIGSVIVTVVSVELELDTTMPGPSLELDTTAPGLEVEIEEPAVVVAIVCVRRSSSLLCSVDDERFALTLFYSTMSSVMA